MTYIHKKKTYASLYLAQMAGEIFLPEQVPSRENNLTENEGDSGSPDPHDDADFGCNSYIHIDSSYTLWSCNSANVIFMHEFTHNQDNC